MVVHLKTVGFPLYQLEAIKTRKQYLGFVLLGKIKRRHGMQLKTTGRSNVLNIQPIRVWRF